MARLYANENFPKTIVAELRRLGHDVLTTLEAGRANQRIPDEEVFAFALQEHRVVLTRNRRHFFRLARMHPNHFGIIACTEDEDFITQARLIHEQIAALASLDGQVIRVCRPSR